jgi:hypothetical protein
MAGGELVEWPQSCVVHCKFCLQKGKRGRFVKKIYLAKNQLSPEVKVISCDDPKLHDIIEEWLAFFKQHPDLTDADAAYKLFKSGQKGFRAQLHECKRKLAKSASLSMHIKPCTPKTSLVGWTESDKKARKQRQGQKASQKYRWG